MGVEHILILGIPFLLLFLILIGSKKRFIFSLINLIVFATYNSMLLYLITHEGKYGASFLWMFYFLISNVGHFIFTFLYLYFNKSESLDKIFVRNLIGISFGVLLLGVVFFLLIFYSCLLFLFY
jgi:hypothetical protein